MFVCVSVCARSELGARGEGAGGDGVREWERRRDEETTTAAATTTDDDT